MSLITVNKYPCSRTCSLSVSQNILVRYYVFDQCQQMSLITVLVLVLFLTGHCTAPVLVLCLVLDDVLYLSFSIISFDLLHLSLFTFLLIILLDILLVIGSRLSFFVLVLIIVLHL
jgi:hypothetical protein